jgi:uncharacterized protein (TIGR03086 family)
MTNVLPAALQALRTTVAGVPAGAWERPTPCANWNVTQVLQHAAGDQLAWAATVGTSSMPDFDPFQPSGTLDGSAAELVERAVAAATDAWSGTAVWSATGPVDGELPTPLPQGKLPAETAANACALDAAVHAWDIAVATGQPSPLTDELAGPILEAAKAVVEPLRGWGAYAPELPAESGDGSVEALLRYLGRDPRWS